MTDSKFTRNSIIVFCVAIALLLLVAWQLSPQISEGKGMEYLVPPPLPTPDASVCTTGWNTIDSSFLGQRVCVRGTLHAAATFDSFFGTRSHPLFVSRPIGGIALRDGDCVMAGGIVRSDGAHPLYIEADSIGLCPLNLPEWWPWG